MINKNYSHRGIICFMIIACWVTGCSSLKVSDIPTLQTGSPLRSVDSKTFAFKEFKDIRIVDDPTVIRRHLLHNDRFEQPPATIVSTLIKKELERNGHKCVTYSSNMPADFIVEGVFFKFSFGGLAGFPPTHYSMTGVKLTISHIPTEKGVFIKTYDAEYSIKAHHPQEGLYSSISGAFLSIMKQISTDLEMVEFLNSRSSSSQDKAIKQTQ